MDTSIVFGEHPLAAVNAPSKKREVTAELTRSAVRLAWHRVAFFGHALAWTLVGTMLTVVAGLGVAVVVGVSWGVAVGIHGYFALAAPELKRKWSDEEIARRLAGEGRAAEDRRAIEGRHARSLEELSASIAHEIRNPITAAKSLLQQIAESPSSPENPEYAKVAVEELDRVERAISHLLRYAREEELSLEDADLADVAASALEGVAGRLAKSTVRIERDLHLGGVLAIRADRDKLRRVVTNLVDNAVDALEAAPGDDPFVRVSCGRSLAGTEVWLRVSDNGPGIDAARLEKVWSPFHTSKSSGTGLGLAITRKLVEAHGGTIELTSEEGRGTAFVATFPSATRAE